MWGQGADREIERKRSMKPRFPAQARQVNRGTEIENTRTEADFGKILTSIYDMLNF